MLISPRFLETAVYCRMKFPSGPKAGKGYRFLLGLAFSGYVTLTAAYDSTGTITAINEARGTFTVDGREYVLSIQARVQYDSDQTDHAVTVSNLRTGEYVQLETQGNLVTKVRRYRNGPPS